MKNTLPHLDLEKKYWNQDFHVIGIDEVGRGPLAGPVTVAGVCFSSNLCENLLTLGINDSKKLSQKKRQALSEIIKEKAAFYSIASSDVHYINTYGIVNAINQAVRKVIADILTNIDHSKPVFVLLDKMSLFQIQGIKQENMLFLVKGDSISISIAAASIIAKVERDNHMAHIAARYPVYGWEKNKGYATSDHCKALQMYNSTPLHRTLFIRNICSENIYN